MTALALVTSLLLACGSGQQAAVVAAAPEPIALAECAVCGMVVREQPAPRGQVLHRDGARLFTCSLGDLRAHLAAPSPHGKAEQVWVESLPADYDAAGIDSAQQSWQLAADARYVVGVQRPSVMGPPALSYATEDQAQAAAIATGGYVVSWQELRTSPINENPPNQEPKTPSK